MNTSQLIHCKSNEMIEPTLEESINERLKFLISKLGLSVRGFSSAIGVTDTNTRNYTDRGAKPNAEYLGKLLKRFNDINPTWLLLGEGEPFTEKSDMLGDPSANAVKNNYGNNVGANKGGTVTQHQGSGPVKAEGANEVAMLRTMVEQLHSQLADKERLIQVLLNQSSK